ncbi:siderophore biosynthesis protein [Microtetraspora sp. AC03309]|uniref:siderophore biosynthesis protein n=1 Tax=Microtetraspora sp. AC03309 TaxID=2779376 RepID=UPI001E57C4FE|nr:siderophore biosynthesis protein [Microtetraspora sp. AC03309]MCC5579854.1 siderophore biosynthesis protein [Microtetraspora sp. AC03309]
MRLYLTSLNPTDSVTGGFLPAAEALGWDVTILTDHPGGYPGFETIDTDVRDVRAVIDTIARHHAPGAVFSNSDHIQAETALAAAYFGLPGKDWRACVTAKNKALTRHRLTPVETVRSVRLTPGGGLPDAVPYPAVVKPATGVASEDVVLVRDAEELADAVAGIRTRRPGEVLVAEEYLDGPLHTLETLGDGRTTTVLGGFRTTLGPLPHFVEERLDWDPEPPPGAREHVLAALAALGVGFGACHTEYVVTRDGPRIIEVNYRVIGDNCDFLLADLIGVPLFEWTLRVHAGEPLPEWSEATVAGHGAVVSLIADRSGVVAAAPPTGECPWDGPCEHDGVRLWHRPLRRVGERVELTRTNRDYLGLLRAVGPDRTSVDAAVASFRGGRPWVIA